MADGRQPTVVVDRAAPTSVETHAPPATPAEFTPPQYEQPSGPPMVAALRGAIYRAMVQAGEMLQLTSVVLTSAVTKPTGYWGDVRDQMNDILRTCWIPMLVSTFAFGLAAPGLQGANLFGLFGIPERLGGFFVRTLQAVAEQHSDVARRLEAILRAHARMAFEQHGADRPMASRTDHVTGVQDRLMAFLVEAVEQAAASGSVRQDVRPDELANYSLHALAAAATSPSKAAVDRLVQLTLDGLQPEPTDE